MEEKHKSQQTELQQTIDRLEKEKVQLKQYLINLEKRVGTGNVHCTLYRVLPSPLLQVKVVVGDEHMIRRYKEQLLHKNLQIEHFQAEIDSIISLCMELQVHGIVLPKRLQPLKTSY